MGTNYLDILRRACDHYGHFPTVAEYNEWAKQNKAPEYQTILRRIGGFKTASALLGIKPRPRKRPPHTKYISYDVPVISAREYFKKRRAFISQKEIVDTHGASWQLVTTLMKTGRFPNPVFKVLDQDCRGTYWNRKVVADFFKNYSPGLYKRTVNLRRRNEILRHAKEVFQRENIKTPREYLDKSLRKKGYVNPKTLWVYSITFEEIMGIEKQTDPVIRDMINLLDQKRTIGELAQVMQVHVRTIYRRIKELREAGLNIKSERGKVWLESN